MQRADELEERRFFVGDARRVTEELNEERTARRLSDPSNERLADPHGIGRARANAATVVAAIFGKGDRKWPGRLAHDGLRHGRPVGRRELRLPPGEVRVDIPALPLPE